MRQPLIGNTGQYFPLNKMQHFLHVHFVCVPVFTCLLARCSFDAFDDAIEEAIEEDVMEFPGGKSLRIMTA